MPAEVKLKVIFIYYVYELTSLLINEGKALVTDVKFFVVFGSFIGISNEEINTGKCSLMEWQCTFEKYGFKKSSNKCRWQPKNTPTDLIRKRESF